MPIDPKDVWLAPGLDSQFGDPVADVGLRPAGPDAGGTFIAKDGSASEIVSASGSKLLVVAKSGGAVLSVSGSGSRVALVAKDGTGTETALDRAETPAPPPPPPIPPAPVLEPTRQTGGATAVWSTKVPISPAYGFAGVGRAIVRTETRDSPEEELLLALLA
jgi:hypothetical protein